jgi:hypothetical protein
LHEFIDRLTEMTRKELLYIEGFLCMHQERYAEYARDFKLAQALGDTPRAEHIREDLQAIGGEIVYLERKQASVTERLRALARDERFAAVVDTNGSDAAQPLPDAANIIPLERAE